MLSAVWYLNKGTLKLEGTHFDGIGGNTATSSAGVLVTTDSNNLFTIDVTDDTGNSLEKIKFGFDDTQETFVRKRFNTNPQVMSAGDFYPSTAEKDYWLGESFEQELRDGGVLDSAGASEGNLTSGTPLVGILLALSNGTGTSAPSSMKGLSSREARAGWFISQHQGTPAGFIPERQQKLFRLIGRGHGEWLHKNAKVSIEKIRQSNNSTSDYGTFSVVIRSLKDTDNNVQVLERFDNLTLDPSSPNYVARRIGDRYYEWSESEKRLREYGDYPNQSRYVYIEMNTDVDAGATDPVLLPFGYFGPPKFKDTAALKNSGPAASANYGSDIYVEGQGNIPDSRGYGVFGPDTARITGSLLFPQVRLRNSASDGGLPNPTNAYFGYMVTRQDSSTRADASAADPHRAWNTAWPTDNSVAADDAGIEGFSYVFSLDNVRTGSSGGYYYHSGARARGLSATSASYTDLLDAGYGNFTAPLWGGFDGFDILKPDPTANITMGESSTEDNNYVFHTYRRAIDTVSDPEFVNMNLLNVPGLTQEALTTHMINVCEDRADALALIDIPNVYLPAHEGQYNARSTKSSRLATTPNAAAIALRARKIDSSYGATFYPWVQTRDENNGQLVWIPPTVAMMGVLASSERATQVWFAPAGFNRGGLSDGAAGIPITNVTERLTSKQRDILYESRINPIASFPSTGIVVFGQKTLQERPSALDRINVRRLVIFLKKNISILSSQILFEQNVQATWNRFTSLIEPFLSNVQTEFGITDYRLILDESTTTPDLIDQNVLYAKIMVKPARAIEFIAIDFVIASTGASFDD